jgi:uncharacterized membrane protein YfcA
MSDIGDSATVPACPSGGGVPRTLTAPVGPHRHAVPLTLIAGVGHWLLGSVDWVLLGSLVMGSLPGIFFGSHLSARVPDKVLRPILATILVIVGVRMLRA